MEIVKGYIEVKVERSKTGWLSEYKHPKTNGQYVCESHRTELIIFSHNNRHVILSAESGTPLPAANAVSHQYGTSIWQVLFYEESQHPDLPNWKDYSTLDFYSSDLLEQNWCKLYTFANKEEIRLQQPAENSNTPDDAIALTYGWKNKDGTYYGMKTSFKLHVTSVITPNLIEYPDKPDELDFPEELLLKSFDETPPAQSTPIPVSKVIIPCYAIPDGNRNWQVKKCPYYILERQQYWQRQYLYTHSGAPTDRKVVTDIGLKHTNHSELALTTNIVIKRDFGQDISFKLDKFPLSSKLSTNISETISNKKVWKRTQTTQSYRNVTSTITRKFTKKLRYALWMLVDLYTLKRIDNSIVKSWEIVRKDYSPEDSYPQTTNSNTSNGKGCEIDVTVESYEKNGDEIVFTAQSDSSLNHEGHFDYKITLMNLSSNEIEDREYGSYWQAVDENPYNIKESHTDIPENTIIIDVEVIDISNTYCNDS